MKLSFSTLGCPNYNMDNVIEMAAKNGFDGVEIRAVSGTVQIASLDEFKGSGLTATKKKLKDAGIEVACVGTGASFCTANAEHQKKTLEDAKVYMEIAAALDCPYVRVFGGPVPAMQSFSESLKWSWEGNKKLCNLAASIGVTPLLETHDDFSTSARVNEILDGISADASDKIGVVWDIAHPYRFGEPLTDTYKALKKYIRHVHVKDAKEFSPAGTDFPLTGEGKIPIAEVVSLLKSGSFTGYLSFEWEKMWHPEIEEPEVAIPHYAEYMRKLI